MTTETTKVIKGPSVTWVLADVRAMVARYGEEEAIRTIAGNVLQHMYVAQKVREIMSVPNV